MAQNDLKLNHTSSSSEEETTSGSEDEQTSGSDSDKKPKQEPQSTNKPQPPDLSSSETEDSGSDTDSDSPPKNSTVVHQKVKPTPDKMTSPPQPPPLPPAKSKRPPPSEKNTKKLKQITTNGDSKISSVTVASSQSAPDPYSDLPPKKSAVANPNVKPAPVKITSSTPPEKSKRPPPSPAPIGKHAKKVKQVPKKASVASSQPAPDLNSSGSESETDTDTDSNSNSKPKKSPVVKFIVSKPMENQEAKSSRSKTKSTPVKSKNENDSKKGKDDESKKQLLFQRLWSEDDEIVILEGMIRYKNERNVENPIADIGAFHEFIKKLLGVDVSNTQLGDKVRRLKKKYVNNASKGRSFSKSHEQKCYELSKLIWGGGTESKKKKKSNSKGNVGGGLLKLNGVGDKDRVIMMEVDENENENENEKKRVDVSRFVQYGGRNEGLIMPEEIVKAGMELVDGNKRAELEGKWRKLKEKELELYVQRMELLKEQALVVLEAVRSSGN